MSGKNKERSLESTLESLQARIAAAQAEIEATMTVPPPTRKELLAQALWDGTLDSLPVNRPTDWIAYRRALKQLTKDAVHHRQADILFPQYARAVNGHPELKETFQKAVGAEILELLRLRNFKHLHILLKSCADNPALKKAFAPEHFLPFINECSDALEKNPRYNYSLAEIRLLEHQYDFLDPEIFEFAKPRDLFIFYISEREFHDLIVHADHTQDQAGKVLTCQINDSILPPQDMARGWIIDGIVQTKDKKFNPFLLATSLRNVRFLRAALQVVAAQDPRLEEPARQSLKAIDDDARAALKTNLTKTREFQDSSYPCKSSDEIIAVFCADDGKMIDLLESLRGLIHTIPSGSLTRKISQALWNDDHEEILPETDSEEEIIPEWRDLAPLWAKNNTNVQRDILDELDM